MLKVNSAEVCHKVTPITTTDKKFNRSFLNPKIMYWISNLFNIHLYEAATNIDMVVTLQYIYQINQGSPKIFSVVQNT